MKEKYIESIHRHLREQGVKLPLNAETKFEDMDIDSLGLYSMAAGVEDEYDIIINCGEFAQLTGVDDLSSLIEAKLNDGMAVLKAA